MLLHRLMAEEESNLLHLKNKTAISNPFRILLRSDGSRLIHLHILSRPKYNKDLKEILNGLQF